MPEAEEGEQTSPEAGEGEQTPPEAGEGEQTSPEAGEGEQTPPEAGEGEQTSPEAGEGEQTPPEAEEGEQTPPEAGEAGEAPPEVEASASAGDALGTPEPGQLEPARMPPGLRAVLMQTPIAFSLVAAVGLLSQGADWGQNLGLGLACLAGGVVSAMWYQELQVPGTMPHHFLWAGVWPPVAAGLALGGLQICAVPIVVVVLLVTMMARAGRAPTPLLSGQHTGAMTALFTLGGAFAAAIVLQ